jgi:hypothetical protein
MQGDNQCKTKRKFSPEEDALIVQIIEKQGARNWSAIAKTMPDRTGRQIRERWTNYLAPDVADRMKFTEVENSRLLNVVSEVGEKWSEIAARFPGRTGVHLRNQWMKLNSWGKKKKENPTVSAPPGEKEPTWEEFFNSVMLESW